MSITLNVSFQSSVFGPIAFFVAKRVGCLESMEKKSLRCLCIEGLLDNCRGGGRRIYILLSFGQS